MKPITGELPGAVRAWSSDRCQQAADATKDADAEAGDEHDDSAAKKKNKFDLALGEVEVIPTSQWVFRALQFIIPTIALGAVIGSVMSLSPEIKWKWHKGLVYGIQAGAPAGLIIFLCIYSNTLREEFFGPRAYMRTITAKRQRTYFGAVQEDINAELQKAVTHWMLEVSDVGSTFRKAFLNLKMEQGFGMCAADKVPESEILTVLPRGVWITAVPRVDVRVKEDKDDNGVECTIVQIRSKPLPKKKKKCCGCCGKGKQVEPCNPGLSPVQVIDAFLEEAWGVYAQSKVDEVKKKPNVKRQPRDMLLMVRPPVEENDDEPQGNDEGDGEGKGKGAGKGKSMGGAKVQPRHASGALLYHKYFLYNTKTFDSVFFPEKEKLLKVIDDFENGTGKYAIKGYPQKLGLLLHGPPGTGKTSIIKAMAAHMSRDIISVSFACIATNAELMGVIFDGVYNVVTTGSPPTAVSMHVSRVLFTFEDLDAISKIIWRRDLAPVPMQEREAEIVASDYAKTDRLNLAGILNVIDGVVEAPKRAMVMTSNYPERIDPALLRPGRIDKMILLSYLGSEAATSMLKMYYGDIDGEERTLLEQIVQKVQMTPCFFEQKCAECDNARELLQLLDLESEYGPLGPAARASSCELEASWPDSSMPNKCRSAFSP